MKRMKQGEHVTANGFPGVVVREYSCRMYEVRLPGGLVCVDISDIERTEYDEELKSRLQAAKAEGNWSEYRTILKELGELYEYQFHGCLKE